MGSQMSARDELHRAMLKSETDYDDWSLEAQLALLEAITPVADRHAENQNSLAWRKLAMEKEAELVALRSELDALSHLISETETGDAILAKREARMRAALCFYAHPDTYRLNGHPQIDGARMPVLVDMGGRAREALVYYT